MAIVYCDSNDGRGLRRLNLVDCCFFGKRLLLLEEASITVSNIFVLSRGCWRRYGARARRLCYCHVVSAAHTYDDSIGAGHIGGTVLNNLQYSRGKLALVWNNVLIFDVWLLFSLMMTDASCALCYAGATKGD